MELSAFLDAMRAQTEVVANSETHLKMHELSQQALQITAQINGSYHTPEELRELMQMLTNGGCGDDLSLFPFRPLPCSALRETRTETASLICATWC